MAASERPIGDQRAALEHGAREQTTTAAQLVASDERHAQEVNLADGAGRFLRQRRLRQTAGVA